jgi:hypothetical protein
MRDHRLKDFSGVSKRLIDGSLANRADLNEVLLCVEKDGPERFAIEKPHLGTKVCARANAGSQESMPTLSLTSALPVWHFFLTVKRHFLRLILARKSDAG